jgi:hypothetical protein
MDGQVCRLWRQNFLYSPRAWAHLEISRQHEPTPSKLHQWLDRSGTVPLHIDVFICTPGIEEVLDQHHQRIESLTVHDHSYSLLENRSFPILQSLTLNFWYQYRTRSWKTGSDMPALRSLRVHYPSLDTPPIYNFPPLRFLALCNVEYCDHFIQNSHHSLTSLMLERISLQNTSGFLEFPCLSFLSLYRVNNLKHCMKVPALTTYHEGGGTEEGSFPIPLPLLSEYGICRGAIKPLFNATTLHECYPNLSRLSIYANSSAAKSFIHSLVCQPTALPMLRLLALRDSILGEPYSREDKHSMMNDVMVRNMAGSVMMELCFDGSLRVPLYFAAVRVYIKEDRGKTDISSEPI